MKPEEYSRIISELILANPASILEIGAASGYGTLLYHKACPEAKIMSVDVNEFEPSYNKEGTLIEPKETWHKWKEYCSIKGESENVKCVIRDANELELPDEQFGALVLDANHGFTNEMGDYGIYQKIKHSLRHNAIVFIHDIFPINGKPTSDGVLFFELSQTLRHAIWYDLGIVWLGERSPHKLMMKYYDSELVAGNLKFDAFSI